MRNIPASDSIWNAGWRRLLYASLCGGTGDNATNLGTREFVYRQQRDQFSAKFEIAFGRTTATMFGDFLTLHRDEGTARLCLVKMGQKESLHNRGVLGKPGSGAQERSEEPSQPAATPNGGGGAKIQTRNQGNARTQDGKGKKHLYE
ncbi:hypothetical protein V500_00468 [Pseudogymnoascus sp. VKM F-4518 (FW-2643)]|nr:hypothetical protein V500_00468 [Pseudogymnoascus sp. VKM F-4518 (FW-2643)]